MHLGALDIALADHLLGIIEHTPSAVQNLADITHRPKADVLNALTAVQYLGVPIERLKNDFLIGKHAVHLNEKSLACEYENYFNEYRKDAFSIEKSAVCSHEKNWVDGCENISILRPHIIGSSHTWLVDFLSGQVVDDYAHKHPLFAPQKVWPVTNTFVIVPEFQTHGVGRQGRTWHSGYAQGALCSVAKFLPLPPQQLIGLSLACGADIATRLNRVLSPEQQIQLKWPNDMIRLNTTGYDKLGGVLVELVPSTHNSGCWVVVGVGLNVGSVPKWVEREPSTQSPHNTPDSVVGVSRQQAVSILLTAVNRVLHSYSSLGFAHWRTTWQNLHAFDKKNVLITQACGTLQGRCDGVDERGALLLTTPTGQTTLYSGDVSLRPASK